MCGRFTLRTEASAIAKAFNLANDSQLPLRFNIAPSQPVAVVRANPAHAGRELVQLHWGLIPSWADDPAIGNRMINARAETVAEKPAFRQALRSRRCLVLADGFYEWRRKAGKKQPYYVTLSGGGIMAFAGLWEHWRRGELSVDSCTIITTDANEIVRPIHNRMPAIVPPDVYELWLDAQVQDPRLLESLLRPYPAAEMTAHPISTLVNNARNEQPECIEPLESDEEQNEENEIRKPGSQEYGKLLF